MSDDPDVRLEKHKRNIVIEILKGQERASFLLPVGERGFRRMVELTAPTG
jgi:hypothetical protein